MNARRDGGRAGGFTLVELLVVIALIALLVGLLIPTLARSRESARVVKCSANHRNLISAFSMYANDFKGIPPKPNWQSVEVRGQPEWLYTPPMNPIWEQHRTGSLFEYVGEVDDIYRCPAHKDIGRRSQRMTSYLENGAVVGFGRVRVAYAIDRFRPDAIIYWEASETSDGWNDGSSYPDEGMTRRHGMGATVGLVDGSCPWLGLVQFDRERDTWPSKLWCNPGRDDGR